MNIEQQMWSFDSRWSDEPSLKAAQLVLVFGSPDRLRDQALMGEVFSRWPGAEFFGCSTAGEIEGTRVVDETLTCTAIAFDQSRVSCHWRPLPNTSDCHNVGRTLGRDLTPNGLRHVLVLSDGIDVNGTDLVRGLSEEIPVGVSVTGGLAADGSNFNETLVICGQEVGVRRAAVVGLYGADLSIGFGSLGGWDPFGPERIITRAEGNVLHELDGRSALELYERYLGEHAAGLPATGLLFPLALRQHGSDESVVRTILTIDRKAQTMTFAGDLPEGAYARLMRANFDRLIDGATVAATNALLPQEGSEPELALLISCVGRKMVLQQRIEEEIEAVQDVLGQRPALTGFYSYGEISPLASGACELHNQTMTITTFSEGAR